MANVFVGFHDQRNSSRILKPPGGGTSDIFGTDALKAQKNTKIETVLESTQKNELDGSTKDKTEKSDQNVQDASEEKSEMLSCTENEIQDEKNSNLPSEEPKIESLNINEGEDKCNDDKGAPDCTSEKKTEPKVDSPAETISSIISQKGQTANVEPERKSIGRVPPGGYSSGLW